MSIKVRLANMERLMIKPEAAFRICPVTGWWLVGGNRGVLATLPVMTPEAWLNSGKEAASRAI